MSSQSRLTREWHKTVRMLSIYERGLILTMVHTLVLATPDFDKGIQGYARPQSLVLTWMQLLKPSSGLARQVPSDGNAAWQHVEWSHAEKVVARPHGNTWNGTNAENVVSMRSQGKVMTMGWLSESCWPCQFGAKASCANLSQAVLPLPSPSPHKAAEDHQSTCGGSSPTKSLQRPTCL